jgi:hypothetical protein
MNRAAHLFLIAIAAAASACQREEIRVYTAPKDDPSPLANNTAAAPPATSTNAGEVHHDHPTWTKPESWTEQPASSMRRASFLSGEKDGERADISVVTLSGPAGGMLANVNRWRGQIALAEIDEATLNQQLEPIEIAGEQGHLMDMAGEKRPEGKTKPQRTVAAVIVHEGTSWFFKMTGEDSVVAAEKPAFIAFLKAFRFH